MKTDVDKVIMACTQPYWSCLQTGSQQLARQFARHNYEVIYISAPVTPMHVFLSNSYEVRKRFKNAIKGIPQRDRIKSLIPFSFIAPHGIKALNNKIITKLWHKSIFPNPHKYIEKYGLKKTKIFYIDNIHYHFLLDKIKYEKCIFRIMDRHDSFPGWKGKTDVIARKIAEKADLTIYSAHSLKDYVKNLHPQKSVFTPNGVDFEHFSKFISPLKRHPILFSIPDPMVIYSGMVDSRFHIELVTETARKLPRISFVIIGPVAGIKIPEKLPKNLYFTGPAPHQELPQIMSTAKAGLIPFDVNKQKRLIHGIRPLKILEYMAAGLPVISARWPEVESMNSPAWMYDDSESFMNFVNKAVTHKHNPEQYREFAKNHDWKVSFNQIMDELTW